MALVTAPNKRGLSYVRLIEATLHLVLPITKVPFRQYWSLEKAAHILAKDKGELLYEIINSNQIHAVRIHTGDVYIHPDGLLKFIKAKGQKLCRSIAKDCLKEKRRRRDNFIRYN